MSSLAYRPEIDGLRAIAVLAVIGYHAGLTFLPGGFLGVDIFFVISGFVIGRLLKSEFDSGQFSLRAFFARRIRRLGPALIVVLACSFAAALILMKPWDMERFSQSVVSVFGIYANRYFMKSTDYFSPAADTQPLLHVWSLSIEEQFYLVLPLVLLALWKFRLHTFILPLLVFLTLASFSVAAFYPYKLVATPFYSFETRIWELLAGVVLAHCITAVPRLGDEALRVIAIAGFVLVLTPLFLPGFARVAALPVVLGTLFVIAATPQGGMVQRLLALRGLVGIGLISYSLYLWHQPVLAFARLGFGVHNFSITGIMFLLTLIFLLSVLSYRWVETPFRNSDGMVGNIAVPASLGLAAMLSGIAFAGTFTDGFKSFYLARQSPEVAARVLMIGEAISSRGVPKQSAVGDCRFWSERLDEASRLRLSACSKQHGAAIVVLGDSHAIDLFNAFKATSGAPFVIGLSRGACGPARFHDGVCPYSEFDEFLRSDAMPVKRVFLTLSGNYFFADQKNPEVLDKPLAQATAGYVAKLGTYVPVVWVGPQYEPHVDIENLDPAQALDIQLVPASLDSFQARDRILADFASNLGVNYVSKIDGILIDAKQDFFAEGQLTYSDTDHWSSAGEKLFGGRLTATLQKTGYLP